MMYIFQRFFQMAIVEVNCKIAIMKISGLIFVFSLPILLLSCDKDPLYIDDIAGELVGCWIDQDYSDTLFTLSRASYIPEDTFGWTFNESGTLVNRGNSGCCGTPPIAYADYEGEWFQEDSIINIEVAFWGGIMLMEWQIVEISESSLTYYQKSQKSIPD